MRDLHGKGIYDNRWLFNIAENRHNEVQWLENETSQIQTRNNAHMFKSDGN